MKRFTKSILFTALACFIAGSSVADAQNKSGGKSGFRNFGGSLTSGRQSSGSGNSMSSRILQSRGGSSSKPGGSVIQSGSIGRPSSGSSIKVGTTRPSGNSPITSPKLSCLSNSIIKPSHGRPTIGQQNSSGGIRPTIGNTAIGKGTLIPSVKPTPSVKPSPSVKPTPGVSKPWTPKPGNGGFTTIPFRPNGSGGSGTASQSQSSQSQQSVSGGSQVNWKHALQHILTHNKTHWCHTRPASCHWWTQYCQPVAHCHHNEVIICDWNRVQCSTVIQVGLPAQDVQWYLGMKGILLPGKGIGIDSVEANSPAAMIGLQPGMVITVCNGIELIDETAMQEAIRISGGVLQMTLLSADGSQVLEGVAVMTRVATVNF